MPKRSTRFYRKNEAEVMKRLGLEPTKNSGAGWIEKSDGQNEFLICELKSTDARSMKINLKDLHTLEYNAIVSHKIPVFAIQFLETGEVFVLAKPADLPSVTKYLDTGKCDIIKSEIEISTNELGQSIVVKSGNRDSFYQQKKEEWENCQRLK